MNVNPINRHIIAGGFKWQMDDEIKDLEQICSTKEKQIDNWTAEVTKIETTPYQWLKQNIHKDTGEQPEIDEEYVKWMHRAKS